MDKVKPYAKAAVAVLGVLALAAQALTDGHLTADEISAVITAAVAAVGVYLVPNSKPVGRHAAE